MTTVFLGLLAAGTAGCAAFVVLYHYWMPWTSSRFGRHMMAFTTMLGVLFGLTLVNNLVGPYRGQLTVSTLALAAMVVVIFRHLWILVDARRRWRGR